MLRRGKKLEYELIWPLTRSEYILSYCCPPNLARVIMESAEYAYAVSEDSVYTGMYGENQAHFHLANGADFVMTQTTDYPYDGNIRLQISDIKKDGPVTLMLRIPGWAERAEVTCHGRTETYGKESAGSYLSAALSLPGRCRDCAEYSHENKKYHCESDGRRGYGADSN